ncbi:hypothetical protein V676_02655, partial [Staphylococcus argenteus]
GADDYKASSLNFTYNYKVKLHGFESYVINFYNTYA